MRLSLPRWLDASVLLVASASIASGAPARDDDDSVRVRAMVTVGSQGPVVDVRVARPGLPRGAGFAVLFDERAVTLFGVSCLERDGLLTQRTEDEPDVDDLDGDPRTNRLVRFAWLSPGATFAGDRAGGLLATLHFAGDPRARLTIVGLSGERAGMVGIGLGETPEEPLANLVKTLARTQGTSSAMPVSPHGTSTSVAAACTLDVDGNGRLDATTDGTLLLRYLFGVRGDVLVAGGAVGPGATRPSSAALAEFLARPACVAMLDVDANGRADALTDGILVARGLFGLTGAALVDGAIGPDAGRATADAVARHLAVYKVPTVSLEVSAPVSATSFLSGIPMRLLPEVRYTGEKRLVFGLLRKPDGMTLEPTTGALSWTAPTSDEGRTVTVEILATDGDVTAGLTFSLAVARPVALASQSSGTSVSVTAAGSLQGLSISGPGVAGLTVGTLAASDAPAAPASVLALTDVFRTSAVSGSGPVEIGFPRLSLPPGRDLSEVSLYLLTDTVTESLAPAWRPSRQGLSVRQDGIVRIVVHRLGVPFFLGLDRTPPAIPPGAPLARRATGPSPRADGVCSRPSFLGFSFSDHWECRAGDLTVTIRGHDILSEAYGSNAQWWPTREVLTGWVYDAYARTKELGLSPRDRVELSIERPLLSDRSFVLPAEEASGTLHLVISSDLNMPFFKYAVLHEYFHHAEHATKGRALIDFVLSGWVLEGLAEWFADEVYDPEDLFGRAIFQPQVLPPVLRPGLDSAYEYVLQAGDRNPYDRFAFWKMVRQRCGASWFGELLKTGLSTSELGDAMDRAACLFGDGLGRDRRSGLEAALLRYQSATQGQNLPTGRRIALLGLESDERSVIYFGADLSTVPSVSPATPIQTSATAVVPGAYPARAGAASFYVEPHDPVIGPDEEVILRVEADSNYGFAYEGAWVNVAARKAGDLPFAEAGGWSTVQTGTPAGFDVNGLDAYTFRRISGKAELKVADGLTPQKTVPEMFLNFVRAEVGSAGVRARLVRRRKSYSNEILSPKFGTNTSQREIEISGRVNADLRARTAVLRVSTLDGRFNVSLADDGTYKFRARLRLGSNVIEADALLSLDETVPAYVVVFGTAGAAPEELRAGGIRAWIVWSSPGDVDLYGTDPAGRTIWYGQKSIPGVGLLNGTTEEENGTGAEYLQYLPEYTYGGAGNGVFRLDVHYYKGPLTNSGILRAVLNEGTPSTFYRERAFQVRDPDQEAGQTPGSTGNAWAKDLLKVGCNDAMRLCWFLD